MSRPSRPTFTGLSSRTSHVIRKVILTLLTGGATYLVTDLSNQPQTWAVTWSLFIGGVTLVVQFLVDFESRLHLVELAQTQHLGTIEGLVEDKFSKINEATELFGSIEDSALRTDEVTQLVRHSTRLDPSTDQLIYDFAQSQLGRISDLLKGLGEGGDVSYEGEDRDWLLGLTHSARSTIDAASLPDVDASGGFAEGGFWTSDLGQRYLEGQRDAVQRGVTIRRVFVVERSDQAGDADLLRICKLHMDLGVKVRILDPSMLPRTRQTSMFDFILFDGVVSYETTPAAAAGQGVRPTIAHTRLVLPRPRVAERVQRFKDLWEAAQDPP